ncbi:TadE/TadG family type IV pilus assembly protein [Prosthecomicrobium sp. N25]|uniref:TadE/TadG family type IV pilus assembly protein n=1 Tax=Prosthecomicrobium sp. N25 TaxID=3129254 RepID=UPI0030780D38
MADRRGAAILELSLVLPLLFMLALLATDFGFGLFRGLQVQNAAQSGLRSAVVGGFDAARITAVVQGAAGASGITMASAPRQFCGCPATTGVQEIACSSTCSGGATAGTYATLTLTARYTPWLATPLLPNGLTFTTRPLVRLQ